MKQMLGFSAEVGTNRWHKIELTLEEADWLDLKRKYDFPDDVPTALKFLFLENELLMLVSSHVLKLGGYEEEASQSMQFAADQRLVLIDKIKGVEPAEEAASD